MHTKEIVLYSLFTAMVLLATYVIRIPTPNGYAHLGDAVILAVAVGYNRRAGIVSGAFGTALADVLGGYFIWAPFSFVIHGLQAALAGTLANKGSGRGAMLLAMLVASAVMVVLYQLAALLLYGMAGCLESLPGNVIQCLCGVVCGILLAPLLKNA